jgi:hypothetical protein
MKTGAILFIIIFVFASLICLAYNQEGFVSSQNQIDNKVIVDTIPELEDTLNKISKFTHNLGTIDKDKITSNELNAISEKLTSQVSDVSAKLNLLIAKLNQNNEQNNRNVNIAASENLGDSADVKASQIIQDERIKTLKERLAKLQNNFGNYIQTKNEKNYPKIPVYSSCVISEASGTYSLDPEKIQGSGKLNMVSNGDRNVVPSVVVNNPLKTIGNTQIENENDASVMIEQILEGLSKKDVQINFNIPENK